MRAGTRSIDWRDPFPFWNEEAGEYWMLLAAREKAGPDNRRGCIALMTSPDSGELGSEAAILGAAALLHA